jgi:hypothetical protein
MNLCEKCEWCSTCLKRGECIPVTMVCPWCRVPDGGRHVDGCEGLKHDKRPYAQPIKPLKFPEINPNLLPTKETTA